jgi:serine/threonine-protein kinase
MGAVFRARDTKLERHVALKLLPLDQAQDAEIVERFYQEGRASAQLDHENIARVFSIGQDGAYHYIAFEFIAGATVRQRVEACGALPVAEAVHIALQIAQALVHASERGVVHRDIKPSNIIITPSGTAKLVDMGLARRFERGGDNGLTQSGMTLGTFDYISPEQARDPRGVDVRSDLYSLGCTLFHMLTGRPPFPGGTVLQKLIQHQEEPPADVRLLNPAVPVELAAIIAKLMAKERDRRYQMPEQLVRDLLVLAGAMGLAPAPSAFLTSLGEERRASSEHHLVWLLPALGFVIVVGGLAWWGSELARPSSRPEPYSKQPSARAPGAGEAESALLAKAALNPAGGDAGSAGGSALPAYPRSIPVTSTEDLLEILATAPPRSVVVLADDGPYRLGGRSWSHRGSAALANLDVTIKAETGVRPLLKFASEARLSEQPPSALFHFAGGHVTIDGLEFELDFASPGEAVAAIRAEDAELLVRGCSFRRAGAGNGKRAAALWVQTNSSTGKPGERPPQVLADSCHFDGEQTGILAQGAVDVVLRDCTMGPAGPSVWFDNAHSAVPLAGELRLIHASILAAAEPVLRFEGSQVRVWVDDSVIAPAGHAAATLVGIDNPRNLSWRGRFNLYAQVGTYLTALGEDEPAETISDFSHWRESATELREAGSEVLTASVWDATDPAGALAREKDNPTRAFLLSPSIAANSDVGARRGPFGSNLNRARMEKRLGSGSASISPPVARAAPRESVALHPKGAADAPEEKAPGEDVRDRSVPVAEAQAAGSQSDPMNLPSMPPMAPPSVPPLEETTKQSVPGDPPAASQAVSQERSEEPARAARQAHAPTQAETRRPDSAGDEDVVRSSAQFMSMLERLAKQGGTLRIAAGAEIELPTILIERAGRYQIVAEPGATRPRLRFRLAPAANRSGVDWSVLLNLRAGSLLLQGLDLEVRDGETQRAGRLAALGVVPGADLVLSDCTVTVAVTRPECAIFVVQPQSGSPRSEPRAAASPSAVIRVRDSFLRSGGDGCSIPSGRRLELELSNALVSTEGSLLHSFGSLSEKSSGSPALRVRLDSVTARVKGGLVHLDSTPEDPELATAAIVVHDSIMSTANRDDPLFRLDGRDQLEDLGDKIRWEGHNVSYDRIKTYRRDEVARTGVVPRIYDRANWTSAFLPKDETPLLEVRFLREADPSQPAWRLARDDFRLAPGGPAADTGADLSRIPQAPPAGEL